MPASDDASTAHAVSLSDLTAGVRTLSSFAQHEHRLHASAKTSALASAAASVLSQLHSLSSAAAPHPPPVSSALLRLRGAVLLAIQGPPPPGAPEDDTLIALLTRAVKLAPTHGPGLALLGEALVAGGRFEEAEVCLRDAVAAGGEGVWRAHVLLAQLLRRGVGTRGDALAVALSAVQGGGADEPSAWACLGAGYLKAALSRGVDEALLAESRAAYARAVRLEGGVHGDPDLHYNAAQAALLAEDFPDAVARLRRAAFLDPGTFGWADPSSVDVGVVPTSAIGRVVLGVHLPDSPVPSTAPLAPRPPGHLSVKDVQQHCAGVAAFCDGRRKQSAPPPTPGQVLFRVHPLQLVGRSGGSPVLLACSDDDGQCVVVSSFHHTEAVLRSLKPGDSVEVRAPGGAQRVGLDGAMWTSLRVGAGGLLVNGKAV